jgi:RNA polymerase sigma-70 factor (ECF subfamily)
MSPPLARTFVEACGQGEPSGDLERALSDALSSSRAAWPDVEVPDERFVRELAGRLRTEGDAVEAIHATCTEDLYLAVGCAHGEAAALSHVERSCVPSIRHMLLRMGFTPSEADETLQVMREELFVVTPGHAAGIADYAGRGSLRGWLRAVAGRIALRASRRRGAHVALNDSSMAATTGDPELECLKQTYAEAFRMAFRQALAALSQRERLLLKQRFRHHLGVEELGVLHGVHASTVSRWVTDAREHLVNETRDQMMSQLKLGRPEVASVLRLIRSQLDITLSSDDDEDRAENGNGVTRTPAG